MHRLLQAHPKLLTAWLDGTEVDGPAAVRARLHGVERVYCTVHDGTRVWW